MKRKIKLISTIASLALVLAIMTFTALAAQSVNVLITNNVSYNVSANVKAIISATKEAGNNTIIKSGGDDIEPIIFTGDEDEEAADAKGELILGDVELEAVSIASGKTIIFSYTITIENTASSDDDFSHLTVVFDAPIELPYIGGYGVSVIYGGTYTSTGHSNTSTLAPGQTHTMTVIFTGDANISHNTTGTNLLNSSVDLMAVTG